MITKYNFYVYDVTDPNNPSDLSIWQRGLNEASQVLDWMKQGKTELVIKRNGRPNDQKTTYAIWPNTK